MPVMAFGFRDETGDRVHDLIVIVPGIMGSALVDREQRVVWGATSAGWYLDAWLHRHSGLRELALTPAELEALDDNRYDPAAARIQPDGLLHFPSWAPFLRGVEPYGNLVAAMTRLVVDPAAVVEFAYDWRLPTQINSELLAGTIDKRLDAWRHHPAHDAARRAHPHQRDAQVVVVAHSMGGLIVQGLAHTKREPRSGFDDVRLVVTLGTPFHGAPKAVQVLATGAGAPVPLPKRSMRELARSLPGLYDLLPRTACLITGQDARTLTAADVAAVGGAPQLAQAAFDRYAARQAPIPHHHALVGTHQDTAQSLAIDAGAVDLYAGYVVCGATGEPLRGADGALVMRHTNGDGTVPFPSATPYAHENTSSVAQEHGALGKTEEVLAGLEARILRDADLGPRLGAGDIGLEVPDLVTAGEAFAVIVTGSDGDTAGAELDPAAVTGVITDLGTGQGVRPVRPAGRRDGQTGLVDEHQLPEGLYRVTVKHHDGSPVSRILLVQPAPGVP